MVSRRQFVLKLPHLRPLVLGKRTLLMGALNVTPDSFSDGGLYYDRDAAIARGVQMEEEGADIIDVGGESTRPGSEPVPAAEEMRRVLPVIAGLRRRLRIPISVDTYKADVAEAAVRAGAEIINDISGLRFDPDLAEVAKRLGTPLVLMHIRGQPRTMQQRGFAKDVLRDVLSGLRASLRSARAAKLSRSHLVVDPGIGFGKSAEQNLELLAHLEKLAGLGCPVLVGPSRKSFIGKVLDPEGPGLPAAERIWGTAAAVTTAILHGAHILRVHDVKPIAQVARLADAILAAA